MSKMLRFGWKETLMVLAGVAVWINGPVPGWAAVQFSWVQLIEDADPQGDVLRPSVVVRAVVDSKDACPVIYTDKKMGKKNLLTPTYERPMDPTLAKGFSEIKVCEAYFGPNHDILQKFSTVYLNDGGKTVSAILPDLSQGVPLGQMVAYGCTGCRDTPEVQYCSKEDKKKAKKTAQPWYFEKMNKQAAATAGTGIPPLVVHLGDIRYSGQKEQADTWDISNKRLGWKQEFFEPTNALLQKGLMVVLRGNHEGCLVDGNEWNMTTIYDRGSAWFYFFGNVNQTCQTVAGPLKDMLPPFAMDATVYGGTVDKPVVTDKKVRLVFMDTVRTGDLRDRARKETKQLYQGAFDTINDQFVKTMPDGRSAWIMAHIPAYSMKADLEPTAVTYALEHSELGDHLDRIAMMPAAHVHRFNLVRDGDGPYQMVVGNSGVGLSGKAGDTKCFKEGNPHGWAGIRTSNFGYMHARFTVGSANSVSAAYDAPMVSLKDGEPDKSLTVTCGASHKDPMRINCEAFPEMPNVAACKK